jgi:hypothetical protein
VSLTHRHLFACMLFGCTGQPSDTTSETASGETLPGEPGSPDAVTTDGQVAEPPAIALERGLGHEATITEVWLDARASAALTLDARGDVRLWPALPPVQTKLESLVPIRVPIREPLWLSFTRAGEQSFVVAAIDTAQAAHVLEIQLDASGTASFRERFRISPRDPLLELHVLDGGERLLALGVDHRLRLYDGHGKLLSELTEYGLAPWQLRVSGPPESLQLAMVLAGPTRLQRFTITDDRLTKHGEARAFTLDRGPNGNDLALMPSGRVAAVLRRPKAKGPQWSLELHDLDSGKIRVMWGEVKATTRPRLLIVDDQWALLEDGISGYWLDLSKAVVMPGGGPTPFELPKKLEELPPETHVIVQPVPLPGTTERTRKHASVVAGVRAIPVERTLLLDPVQPNAPADGERHYKLGHRTVAVNGLDFESTGELLALARPDKIVVESTTTGSEQPGGCPSENLFRFSFTDPEHLLLLGPKQALICEWRTGKVVATLELADIDSGRIHPTGPGAGQIGLRQEEWVEDANKIELSYATYANNQFGAIEPLAKSDRVNWPELGDEWRVAVVDAAGNRYLASDDNTRKLAITLASGERRNIEIVEPGGDEVDIQRIEPSPDGRFVAIVTVPGSEDYGHGYYGGYGYGPSDPETLSIWAAEPAELRWTTIIRGNGSSLELAWTDDGSRLAIEDAGRLRVITNDGQVLLDRASRDFHLEELPDDPIAAAQPAKDSSDPKPP